MGNYVQNLSERVNLIATADTWIEGEAIQQLKKTATLDGMQYVSGMPDLHPGRGYPVGAAFFSSTHIYPALIGGDIGCGMALWQTGLDARNPNISKLEKKIGNIDGALGEEWQTLITSHLPANTGFQQALGTIGGGNHFAELQCFDEIHDTETFQALGLMQGQLQLLVHSGSRGLGQFILRQHIDQHGHQGLQVDTAICRQYLEAHDQALRFAALNRMLIAQRIVAKLGTDGSRILDVNHNMVLPAKVHHQQGWIHRKGATPADQGAVVIPGSRGDYSYLVLPIPSDTSLHSLAHGAGRKWMRSECKDRLSQRYSVAKLSRTKLGNHVICADRQLMYEEAPEAYKPVNSIITALAGAGLIKIIARLKPILTYKTRGENCE